MQASSDAPIVPVVFISHALDDKPEELGRLRIFEEGLRAALREEYGTFVMTMSDRRSSIWDRAWRDRRLAGGSIVGVLMPVLTHEYFSSTTCTEDLLGSLPASMLDEAASLSQYGIVPIRWDEAIPEKSSALAKLFEGEEAQEWFKIKRENPDSPAWQIALKDLAHRIREGVDHAQQQIAQDQTAASQKSNTQQNIMEEDPFNQGEDPFYEKYAAGMGASGSGTGDAGSQDDLSTSEATKEITDSGGLSQPTLPKRRKRKGTKPGRREASVPEQAPEEVTAIAGLSTHVARDRWTVDDALGYEAYAHAIYRFITHPETKPPLTVSIQAPWGGGKSSLMRMIQKRLDPEGYQAAERGDRAIDTGGELTVRDTFKELSQYASKDRRQATDEEPPLKQKCLTVWFNVWKYQSTEQVWGGLADAIIREFAERLDPVEREKFWLRLHLRRLDTGKIRRMIYNRFAGLLWKKLLPWLGGLGLLAVGSVAAQLAGLTLSTSLPQNWGFGGAGLALLLFAAKTIQQAHSLKAEPADMTLGEFVTAPDYGKELGFVHHVQQDLQHVLELTHGKCGAIVVFVDDLDRCSPEKVADVVEAINLFLAGEFPDCIFILGMDSEMVAAALEEAHSKVIAKLPKDATSTPIGWRFMDKFVQLPFAIPPPDTDDLTQYAESLMLDPQSRQLNPDVRSIADEIAREAPDGMENMAAVAVKAKTLATERNLADELHKQLEEQLKRDAAIRNMDRGIRQFSDHESQIAAIVQQSASQFSRNPRELKRFVNIFRFLYFLRWAREGRDKEVPSLDQLGRWILLYMKWPQVVRWIRRSYSGRNDHQKHAGTNSDKSRLQQLEALGRRCKTPEEWLKNTQADLQLDSTTAPWIADRDLIEFFREEGRKKVDDRLSAAEGKGLW